MDEHTDLIAEQSNNQNSITSIEVDGSVVTPTAMQTLPHEILVIILDQLDVDTEKQELRNLRKTCRALASLAAPYLFRKVNAIFHLLSLDGAH